MPSASGNLACAAAVTITMIEPQLDRRALRSVDSWAGTVVSNAWGCDYCLKPNQGGLRSPPRGLAIVLARGLGSFGLAAGSSDITTGLKIITDGRRATRGGEGQAARGCGANPKHG